VKPVVEEQRSDKKKQRRKEGDVRLRSKRKKGGQESCTPSVPT
jgi:hypothetical protein